MQERGAPSPGRRDNLTSPGWFRRRQVGFGWRPASWQGWAITLAAVSAAVVLAAVVGQSAVRLPLLVSIVVVYAIVALLTGGRRRAAAPPSGEVAQAPAPTAPPGPAGLSVGQREALRVLTTTDSTTRASDEPVLVVEHLTKRFGERVAVDDVSFSVAAGEVFGFLGPNGAGKTTTVRMLATLIAPTSGTARDRGRAARTGKRRRDPQAHRRDDREPRPLPAPDGGRESRVLRRPVRAARADAADRAGPRRRSTSAAAQTISAAASRRASANGSRSHACCSAMPAIVFLDEPTSGLDPVAIREVHELIDGLREPRRHRLSHHPPARGGRASLRPGRHPQHAPAHDRPARRVARPALHQDARRAHGAIRSPARTRVFAVAGRRELAAPTATRLRADRQRRALAAPR